MKTFDTLYKTLMESLIQERNEKHDYSEYTLRDLARKFGSDDYIFRFSDSDQRASFNPVAYYNTTPIGTYGFPAKYFIKRMTINNNIDDVYSNLHKNLEYGSDMKYLYILKKKDGYKTFDTDKKANNQDIKKLVRENIIKLGDKVSTNIEIYQLVFKKFKDDKKLPTKLTQVFFKILGYDSIKDSSGTIHRNEPHQEVILNQAGFDVVERIDNLKYSKPLGENKIKKILNSKNWKQILSNKKLWKRDALIKDIYIMLTSNEKKQIEKMIVYNHELIKYIPSEIIINFVKQHYECFSGLFSRYSNNIKYFENDKKYEIIKIFKDSFDKSIPRNAFFLLEVNDEDIINIVKTCKIGFNNLFAKEPEELTCVKEEKILDVLKICIDGFKVGFIKMPNAIRYIPEENFIEVANIYKECFNVVFFKYPSAINYVRNNLKLQILEMFKNSFEVAFKTNPELIKKINKYSYDVDGKEVNIIEKIKEMFPDINFPE